MKPKCSIDSCDNNSRARTWCIKHYQRWNKYGDPNHVEVIKTFCLEDALAVRSEPQGDCLVWLGSLSADGYAIYGGNESNDHGTKYLHRIMWEREMGERIPDGMEIDHLCYVRNCISTSHMRLATRAEQVRNLAGLKKNNKSGVRGVYWCARERCYMAQVRHEGKTHYLGRFTDPLDAKPLVEAKREELYGKDYAG